MARKKWTVIVDWTFVDYEDSHDYTIYADTAAQAKAKAKETWLRLFGDGTEAKILRVWILTAKHERDLAL